METMKVETMGKEIIKPSTKTPNDLRTLQLSMLDQLMPSYVVSFLFYTKAEPTLEEDISQKLKTSLSETLTRFYPFAGRINGATVDCNDEGAVFVDGRVVGDFPLSSFLKSPDFESLQKLLPRDDAEEATSGWPLLLVKATEFQCGGLAIGICISHRLADGASLSTFIRAWAAIARGESDSVLSPEFAATKLYPPGNDAFKIPPGVDQYGKRASVTKRFVFLASKLEELRNKAASADVLSRPTRVQCVTSLIWKCGVATSPDTTREKVLVQPVNLRPKLATLLSENLIGNLSFSTTTMNGKGEVEISKTVKELQNRAEELASLIKEESPKTVGSKLISEMMNQFTKLTDGTKESYVMSSWCRMKFYEANFGWGTPVWVAGCVFPVMENVTLLMDSNDGQGIEAWVTLHQEDMSLFEQNPELLAFASPNLNVLV